MSTLYSARDLSLIGIGAMAAKFGVFVVEDHSKLHTLYRLANLHKRPYKHVLLLILAHVLLLSCL